MNKKYQIIYADPPWHYDFCKDNADKIENHYSTMSLDNIKKLYWKLPIDSNAILFLWATAPKLKEALEVMEAWNFTYKTHAIWDKTWIGMGYWFRGQHELLLIGVRGKMSPPSQTSRKSSIFVEKRRKHSQKPDCVRKYIEDCFPDLTKLELFAREKTEGWTSLGYDIDGKNITESIKLL